MMDKKMNYLAVIPVYGTVILLFWLFIKTLRKEIDMKLFNICLASSAFVGFLSILMSILLFAFIGMLFGQDTFINNFVLFLGYVLGGYLTNLFSFTLVNKKLR